MNQPPTGGYPGQPNDGGRGDDGGWSRDPSQPGGGQPYSSNPYSYGPGSGGPSEGTGAYGPEGTRQFRADPGGSQSQGGYSYGGQQYHQYGGQTGGPQQQYGAPYSYGQFAGPQQPGGGGASSNKAIGWIVGGVIALIILVIIAVAAFFALRPTGSESGALATTGETAAPAEPGLDGSGELSESSATSAPSTSTEASSPAVPPPAADTSGDTSQVRLEASASNGAGVTVTYLDGGTGVQQEDVSSPWSTEFELSGPYQFTSLIVFAAEEADVTCKIFVDGQEVSSNTTSGMFETADCEYVG